MIVDTSVLIAIMAKEPGYREYLEKILRSENTKISAGTAVEFELVARKYGDPPKVLHALGIEITPVDQNHLYWARYAIQNFARGSGSPAKLNFGDCFSYAASRALNEPLLFKGTDFSATDVIAA